MGLLITYTGAVPGKPLTTAALNRVKRPVWRSAGLLWHNEMRAAHFTVEGGRRLGYARRKGEGESGKRFWHSYTGQKQKRKGHQRPLVWSGESERLSRERDVRATSTGARVVLHTPGLNRRPKGGRINLREEMTRVTAEEHGKLVRHYDVTLGRHLRRWRGRAVVKA